MVIGPVGYPLQVRRRFWEQVRCGLSPRDAAGAVGVSRKAGEGWFGEAGGVMPRPLMPALVRPRLTLQQREEIAVLHASRTSGAEIARRVGCHRSTVGRELAKRSTTFNDRHLPRYRASVAQAHADRAGRRPKASKLAASDRLRARVQDRLEEEDSPEQISARLRVDFPDEPEMWVSHETIYQSLYVQGRGALRRELTACLRTGRALRKPHRRPPSGAAGSRTWSTISERPAEVEDRAVPGHWEGDLIIGAHEQVGDRHPGRAATGFVMLLHLPDGHGAARSQEAMVATMRQLPATLRRTLTWDQGTEMANHAQIADGDRPRHLLLRPALALAARHQREHQRAAPPVLPQGHRPVGLRTATTSTTSPASSTAAPAKDSNSAPRPKHSTNYSQNHQSIRCCIDRLNSPLLNGQRGPTQREP